MSEQTDLTLPPNLPYPIKITKRLISEGDAIRRGTPLFHYSFKHKSLDQPEVETRYGTWESPLEGTINFWNIETGDLVSRDYGPVLVVTEPCKHGSQIRGMCATCGKDMTEVDYLSNGASERAKIKMDHSGEGPLMSEEEAARIERENTDHLLRNRKLSLIVDLDQTILHATVDPTVGEWMKAKKSSENGSTTPPLESANWPALADVVQFQLGDDHHGANSIPHPSSPWYYIKPRPGLIRFMNDLTRLYEMHVYTMGTRSYANAVCAALDPTGKWFSSRILTRSESGSDRSKNLKRLFPSDQSMVAIIDDRADVWDWSPNLVKVIAFDFFVGTGDINSSFLPKLKPDLPDLPVVVPPEKGAEHPEPGIPSGADVKLDGIALRHEKQAIEVAKQLEERPLAKAQESVLGDDEQAPNGKSHDSSSTTSVPEQSHRDDLDKRIRKAVLNDDDRELDRVEAILVGTHRKFYEMHDARLKSRSNPVPDISRIIPSLRAKTFEGVHMVFSGVFPLQSRPDHSDVWKTAIAFGATCHLDVNPKITHLVAAKPGTVKADKAFELGGISVVNLQWFHESVAKWERQPEAKYLFPRRHRRPDNDPAVGKEHERPSATALSSTSTHDHKPERVKVSVPDGVGESGTDTRPSVPEDQDSSVENAESAASTGVAWPPSSGENSQMEINWDAIREEVDEALADGDDDDDDDDDDESITESDAADEATGTMEDVVRTTRGVKRRRSETSTPTTPSKLRFSITMSKEESGEAPSGKRQKIVETATPTSNTVPGEGLTQQVSVLKDKMGGTEVVAEDDDDDDDFLAREMAEGGDTDDSDEDETD